MPPDGGLIRAAPEEDGDRFTRYAVTAPIPGLPGLRPDEGLWRVR